MSAFLHLSSKMALKTLIRRSSSDVNSCKQHVGRCNLLLNTQTIDQSQMAGLVGQGSAKSKIEMP